MEINSELIGFIIAVVMGFNALLFGAYKGLEFIKDKTAGSWDNSAYEFLGKVLDILKKIIEIVGPITAVKAATDEPKK